MKVILLNGSISADLLQEQSLMIVRWSHPESVLFHKAICPCFFHLFDLI